jgi:hypothetical protein
LPLFEFDNFSVMAKGLTPVNFPKAPFLGYSEEVMRLVLPTVSAKFPRTPSWYNLE